MDIEQLKKEREYLQNVVDEAAKRLMSAPDGNLIRRNEKGAFRYYVTFGKNNLKYLSIRKKKDLISDLMQKRKDLRILKHIPNQIKAIDSFLAKYNPKVLDEFIVLNAQPKEIIDKSVSDASSEAGKIAADTDLARNLIAICSAFLQSKGC